MNLENICKDLFPRMGNHAECVFHWTYIAQKVWKAHSEIQGKTAEGLDFFFVWLWLQEWIVCEDSSSAAVKQALE